MERMPLMGFAHQKRSGMRPDEGGALRSNVFHAFSLAGNWAPCKPACMGKEHYRSGNPSKCKALLG